LPQAAFARANLSAVDICLVGELNGGPGLIKIPPTMEMAKNTRPPLMSKTKSAAGHGSARNSAPIALSRPFANTFGIKMTQFKPFLILNPIEYQVALATNAPHRTFRVILLLSGPHLWAFSRVGFTIANPSYFSSRRIPHSIGLLTSPDQLRP